jgi:ferritin-like protein
MSNLESEFINKLVSKIKEKLKIVYYITLVAGFKIGLIERGIKTLKDKIKKLEKLNN